jgi:DNA-binding transcriptional ArsR family regulator
MASTMTDIEELQTSMLRSLASRHRLRILHLLGERPRGVNELAGDLELSQATTSQHLGAMRRAGLVEAIHEGRNHRYQVADPQLLAACALMRDVLVRRLSRMGDQAAAAGASPSEAVDNNQVVASEAARE